MNRRTRGRRRTAVAVLVSICAATLLVGCSVAPGPAPVVSNPLVISTSPAGGVDFAWGTSLATQMKITDPRRQVSVEASSGGVANLRRLTLGTADLGLATMDITDTRADACVSQAAEDAADERRVPLRVLGRIYDDYLQIFVLAGSKVHSVADLAGRPVVVGPTGSDTALMSCRVLAAAKIDVKGQRLDEVAGIQALRRGTVAAVFFSGGLPTPSIQQVAGRGHLRLLPLGGLADTLHTRYGTGYRPATIPPGPYGGAVQVATLASPDLLLARADADPAMVTTVLHTIFTRQSHIAAAVPAANATDRRTAILTGALALHPAAVTYYRRTKP